jgi:hypothetical protein
VAEWLWARRSALGGDLSWANAEKRAQRNAQSSRADFESINT